MRVRCLVPMPQVMEQALYGDQALTTQSTAQCSTLQATVSERLGTGAPPCWESTITERVRVLVPPPQVIEHALKADQPETTGLTGHGCVLHWASSCRSGQGVPPWRAPERTVLWRC